MSSDFMNKHDMLSSNLSSAPQFALMRHVLTSSSVSNQRYLPTVTYNISMELFMYMWDWVA